MEDFVDFSLAVKLKEKGFVEKCLYHYTDGKLEGNFCAVGKDDHVSVEDMQMSCNNLISQFETLESNKIVADSPTIPQVLKWLRDEKGLHILVEYVFSEETLWFFEVQKIGSYERFYGRDEDYDTYEQAVLAGIDYVLDNLI